MTPRVLAFWTLASGVAVLAFAQDVVTLPSLALTSPIQDPVSLAIGTLVVWLATWTAKKVLKDALEAVWIPRVALAVSLAYNSVYAGIHSGLDWRGLASAAIVAVVQSLMATGGHELVAPVLERKSKS